MPFITVKLTDACGGETLEALARTITDAMIATLGSKPEWVTIVFEVADRRNWAVGGRLQGNTADDGSRPFVTIKFHKGRTPDKKRQIAARVTDSIVGVIGGDPDRVTVVFDGYAQEDWAIGGKLQLDRHGPVPPSDPV